jgi:hypothetical protein
MKFINLTPTKGKKTKEELRNDCYVNVDDIYEVDGDLRHIEGKDYVVLTGSLVSRKGGGLMGGGGHMPVQETPEQIFELIKNAPEL